MVSPFVLFNNKFSVAAITQCRKVLKKNIKNLKCAATQSDCYCYDEKFNDLVREFNKSVFFHDAIEKVADSQEALVVR